jgi:hypothetical protein
MSRQAFQIYKSRHIPKNGVCPNCSRNRGTDPGQWTLIPGHMYCKYCFQLNVGDKEECRRIRDEFIKTLSDEPEVNETLYSMIADIREQLSLLMKARDPDLEFLCTQALSDNIDRRLNMHGPVTTVIGRYTCACEMDRDLPRNSHMQNLTAVITTPAVVEWHRKWWNTEQEAPEWLAKAMGKYTNDPLEYPLYPCAYVQAIASHL